MNEPVRRKRAVFDWSAAVIMILSIGSAILVFVREGSARFLSILTDDLELFGVMLPKVLAGCLIGAFVTLLLPRETVARCYPTLIEARRRSYEALAHVTLQVSQLRDPSMDAEKFLSLVRGQ